MSDLSDLYREVILDHSKHPHNQRKPESPGQSADGHNPLCGDRITVYLTVEGDVVTDVAFEGAGCAISTASASMMTDSVKGKTLAEAETLFEKFHHLVTGEEEPSTFSADLGKLMVFAGVREFPVRVKCATLAWHTLRAAMDRRAETVSTE